MQISFKKLIHVPDIEYEMAMKKKRINFKRGFMKPTFFLNIRVEDVERVALCLERK